MLCDKDLPTGVASTLISPDGQRTFGTYLGAAANLRPEDVVPEWFDGYDYFYIEGYLVQNHALIRRAVELAHEAGLKVCIDLASYNIVQDDREFFAELLQQTDIVFANEQEAQAFTGIDNAQANVEALASLCEIAVVKIGKKECLCVVAKNKYIVQLARCLMWSIQLRQATISRQVFFMHLPQAVA